MAPLTYSSVVARPSLKILVIDDDADTVDTVAAVLAGSGCEIIACSDMALAEAATDLTEFDLILVAPRSTGVDGVGGLAAADFLAARNPMAVTAMMVPRTDARLKEAVERTGHSALSRPPGADELLVLCTQLSMRLEPMARSVLGDA